MNRPTTRTASHTSRLRRLANHRTVAVLALIGAAVSLILPAIAGAQESQLGSWQLRTKASPAALHLQEPGLGIPADPTAELSLGYTQVSLDSVPSANALASNLWPGPVAADGLAALDPNLPAYPVRAQSLFPAGGVDQVGQPEAGPFMYADSTEAAAEALARTAGSQIPDVVTVQEGASRSTTVVEDGVARAVATSSAKGVDILGLISIESIESVVVTESDGVEATVTRNTVIQGATLADTPIEITPDGVVVADQGSGFDRQGAQDQLNAFLESIDLQVYLDQGTETVENTDGAATATATSQAVVVVLGTDPVDDARDPIEAPISDAILSLPSDFAPLSAYLLLSTTGAPELSVITGQAQAATSGRQPFNFDFDVDLELPPVVTPPAPDVDPSPPVASPTPAANPSPAPTSTPSGASVPAPSDSTPTPLPSSVPTSDTSQGGVPPGAVVGALIASAAMAVPAVKTGLAIVGPS